jgi:hypothetical protein
MNTNQRSSLDVALTSSIVSPKLGWIDQNIATAPHPPFDPEAFAQFKARPEIQRLVERILAD